MATAVEVQSQTFEVQIPTEHWEEAKAVIDGLVDHGIITTYNLVGGTLTLTCPSRTLVPPQDDTSATEVGRTNDLAPGPPERGGRTVLEFDVDSAATKSLHPVFLCLLRNERLVAYRYLDGRYRLDFGLAGSAAGTRDGED